MDVFVFLTKFFVKIFHSQPLIDFTVKEILFSGRKTLKNINTVWYLDFENVK